VDGRESRLYPTNVASLGLPLVAGAHTVDVRVTSTNFVLGVVLSLVSLAILTALIVFDSVRARVSRRMRERR